jgi:hypothetical protein
VTWVAIDEDRSRQAAVVSIGSGMGPELAALRHAQARLRSGSCVDDVIAELRVQFGLDFVDAMAAVAASVVLEEGGFSVPEEPFARPYV